MASPEAATAVAVRDKLILSVGSLESVKASLENQTFTLDEVFKDKIIVPGLIDNHLHPAMAALILPMKFITPSRLNLSIIFVLISDFCMEQLPTTCQQRGSVDLP